MKSTLFVLLGLFLSISARAEMIEFPEEELATESVLPVFDNPVSVKNRNVVTAHRFELGAYAGYDLTEPFYNQFNLGASVTYHLDEFNGINVYGGYFMDGLQSSGESLKHISGTANQINLEYGPHTQWLADVNYQYTAFYGKISLTKDYVMNLSLAGLAGLGMINIGGKAFPLASFGVGQKFYISKSLALRFDLRFLVHQAPNLVGGSSPVLVNATQTQSVDKFEKRIVVGSLLSAGLVFLIPNS